MEQLRRQYRLAEEALRGGRLERAAACVRAAGRELDAILDALATQPGRDRQTWGRPPRRPRAQLRRKADAGAIDAGTVAEVRNEALELMARLRGLAQEVLAERREIRARRQWTAGQETAAAGDRGCVDISR